MITLIFTIFSTVRQSLDYYLSSHSDTMRSSWLMVVQMLLNRTYDLSDAHFCKLGSDYHLSVARLIESDEQPIIRTALYRVVQRFILVNNRFDSQSNGGDHASGAERKVWSNFIVFVEGIKGKLWCCKLLYISFEVNIFMKVKFDTLNSARHIHIFNSHSLRLSSEQSKRFWYNLLRS